MNPVVQEDDYGCGVACVANILGVEYEKAIVLLGKDGKKRAMTFGFHCKELARALKLGGIDYSNKYIKQKDKRRIYEDGAIVFIKRSKKYRAGHFLSRKKGMWYDSWINFPHEKRIAGVRKRLSGRPIYMIYPIDQT